MNKIVTKEWGNETWLVNEAEYCAKYLDISPGKQCSLHYHPIKKETFIVVSGKVRLQRYLEDETQPDQFSVVEILLPGESRTIEPKTAHRFTAEGSRTARVLEISTHHDDADVERLEPSGEYTGGW